jgi:DNA end-binding protein Ku
MYKAARRERVKFHHVYAAEPEADVEEEADPPERRESGSRGVVHEFPRPISTRPSAPPSSQPSSQPQPETVSRVRQSTVADDAKTPVSADSIMKGYEVEKDQFVVLRREEIAALRPDTSTELPILEFVRLAEIDPIYFDTSYYLVPEPEGEKPFVLLVKALQSTGDVALGTLAMHGREHAVVIRPGKQGLILHTLFYANEVRTDQEWKGDVDVSPKELELAVLLIRAMEAPFDPAKLKDTFEEHLRDLIAKRSPTPAAGASSQRERQAKAPVIDIMQALKRSLAAARKPVQKDRGAVPAKSARQKRRPDKTG